MPKRKKSFREFLANDALNPGVKDNELQKVDVDKREIEAVEESSGKCDTERSVTPKIDKKPVGMLFLLGVVCLGLTVGLSFVSLWALWGIVPTLLCWWKMVLNNGDNNLNSVVDRYDSDYLRRIDSKEKEKQKCQAVEHEIEEHRDEEKKKYEGKFEEEEEEMEEKKGKNKRNNKKGNKSKDEDEEDNELFTDDEGEDEEEEEKDRKKVEKSDKKRLGNKFSKNFKVEKNVERDIDNDESRTSLMERNNKKKKIG